MGDGDPPHQGAVKVADPGGDLIALRLAEILQMALEDQRWTSRITVAFGSRDLRTNSATIER
ncbi:hypothetical protein VY88_16710 [Azospirillum thiophilum]|nr:hypothetical protein VY88_16710 [Azospirillum thiophilum]